MERKHQIGTLPGGLLWLGLIECRCVTDCIYGIMSSGDYLAHVEMNNAEVELLTDPVPEVATYNYRQLREIACFHLDEEGIHDRAF